MTAQTPDRFRLDDHTYVIVGVHNRKYARIFGARADILFTPEYLDLTPVATASNCWRGYVCQYAIRDNALVLRELNIGLMEPGPEINGVRPTVPHEGSRVNIYQNLDLPIKFTGGILIGDKFIQELYVHMGFHPAWKFETVIELIFAEGELIERRDVSDGMRVLRTRLLEKPMQPGGSAGEEEIKAWIESTFSLDYTRMADGLGDSEKQ